MNFFWRFIELKQTIQVHLILFSFYYRCPPILEIVLCILSAYMQASKVHLHNHTLVNPILDNASQNEQERRDLKNALIMAQDSAVIQILLECCLPKVDEVSGKLLNIQ